MLQQLAAVGVFLAGFTLTLTIALACIRLGEWSRQLFRGDESEVR